MKKHEDFPKDGALEEKLKFLEEHPQLLFRLGYAKQGRHTPRRPIQEVMV